MILKCKKTEERKYFHIGGILAVLLNFSSLVFFFNGPMPIERRSPEGLARVEGRGGRCLEGGALDGWRGGCFGWRGGLVDGGGLGWRWGGFGWRGGLVEGALDGGGGALDEKSYAKVIQASPKSCKNVNMKVLTRDIPNQNRTLEALQPGSLRLSEVAPRRVLGAVDGAGRFGTAPRRRWVEVQPGSNGSCGVPGSGAGMFASEAQDLSKSQWLELAQHEGKQQR